LLGCGAGTLIDVALITGAGAVVGWIGDQIFGGESIAERLKREIERQMLEQEQAAAIATQMANERETDIRRAVLGILALAESGEEDASEATSEIDRRHVPGPSAEPDFGDPSNPPGDEWEWRDDGRDEVGSDYGAWFNEDTTESLHPHFGDPTHPGHYDWTTRRLPKGEGARWFPDGTWVPK
jgi:hypothetical protein